MSAYIAAVSAYADKIMQMIDEDMALTEEGRVPASVQSFADLHEYVDANEYLLDAGVSVPWATDADLALCNDVTDAVSRRLAARHSTTVATVDSPNFAFLTIGRDEAHARDLLDDAGIAHCVEYGVVPQVGERRPWDDSDVRIYAGVGRTFRDGEAM